MTRAINIGVALAIGLLGGAALASSSSDEPVVRSGISPLEAGKIIAERFDFSPGNWQYRFQISDYQVQRFPDDSTAKLSEIDSARGIILGNSGRKTGQLCLAARAGENSNAPLFSLTNGLDPSRCTAETFSYSRGKVDAVYQCKASATDPEMRVEQHMLYGSKKVSGVMRMTSSTTSYGVPRQVIMTFDMGMDRIGNCPSSGSGQ